MTKVIFYVGLIGMVPPSTWTSEHVSYAQDFYAGKTIRIVVGGFPAGGERTLAGVISGQSS
jgi:hypothetical protein